MTTTITDKNEHGFVLVTAMVFLLALTLLGILASSNSTFERLLGNNERRHTEVFYQADSGANAGIGLVVENYLAAGFSANQASAMGGLGFDPGMGTSSFYLQPDPTLLGFRGPLTDLNGDGNIDDIDEGIFFRQNALGQNGTRYRDTFYPRVQDNGTPGGGPPTTSIKISALDASRNHGGPGQSNNGYDISGSNGNGQGGAEKIYNIRSRHDNGGGESAQVYIQYRHIIRN